MINLEIKNGKFYRGEVLEQMIAGDSEQIECLRQFNRDLELKKQYEEEEKEKEEEVKKAKKVEGYSINGRDDKWTVTCPNCDNEYTHTGWFDCSEIEQCRCGCKFITTKVWMDEDCKTYII